MSVRATTSVWFGSKSTGTTKLVLLAIADCANDEGTAWPSVGTIARKCGLSSPRSVQNHVLALIELGELRVDMGAGRNGVNVYHLQIEWDGNYKKISKTPPQELAGGGDSTPAESCTPPPQNPAPPPRRILHRPPAESCTAPPQDSAGKLSMNYQGTKEREEKEISLSPILEDVKKSLTAIFPNASFHYMPAEKEALLAARETLGELSEDDWEALLVWFTKSTLPARGCSLWPRSRMEFLTFAGDAVEKVRDWWAKKGREWWQLRQKQQVKPKKATIETPASPSEDFYSFVAETERPMSEAIEAWADGRWAKEFNQWLFADFIK